MAPVWEETRKSVVLVIAFLGTSSSLADWRMSRSLNKLVDTGSDRGRPQS